MPRSDRRQVHPAQNFLEARVGAQGVVNRHTKVWQVGIMRIKSLLKPINSSLVVTGQEVQIGYRDGSLAAGDASTCRLVP